MDEHANEIIAEFARLGNTTPDKARRFVINACDSVRVTYNNDREYYMVVVCSGGVKLGHEIPLGEPCPRGIAWAILTRTMFDGSRQ